MAGNLFRRKNFRFLFIPALVLSLLFVLSGCNDTSDDDGDGDGGQYTPGNYVVLAWNDLGMHCLNPTYDQLIILPPYNTLWAQVIERGDPPRIVTNGVQVSYNIINNTTSQNKLSYGQFWNPNVLALFGAAGLAPDTGLNLHDPNIHNGLSGNMQMLSDHFQADGIPVTPVNDGASTKDPYQVALITVKDTSGNTLIQTQATVPTSDEINCGRCHAPGGSISQSFSDILQRHDHAEGTSLTANTPVLCSSCHGSPILGSSANNRGSSGKYLSEAIHGSHAGKSAACYDCHPGKTTLCNRSQGHANSEGNCSACHGTMDTIAKTISRGGKVPWVDEPKCVSCHSNVEQVNTGNTLYRNATGHGNLYCAGCHQSPHAMVPSFEVSDNFQVQQYQGASVPLGSCAACHGTSKPEEGDLEEFRETHTGENPEKRSGCGVCHTALPSNVSADEFPHQFTWKRR